MSNRNESAAVSLADALRRAHQAEAEVARLRAGEEPVTDPAVCTPGQWIWQWNRAAPEERLKVAARIQDAMDRSAACFVGDHDARLEAQRDEIARLRREVEEQTGAKEVYIRLANSAGVAPHRAADEQPAHGPGAVAGRDCLFAHGGGRPCSVSDRCATCDPKEQPGA